MSKTDARSKQVAKTGNGERVWMDAAGGDKPRAGDGTEVSRRQLGGEDGIRLRKAVIEVVGCRGSGRKACSCCSSSVESQI